MNNEMISVPRGTLQKWLDDIGPSRHVTQYASLKRDELRALLAKPDANTDVRTILLDVVPGDGDGREVYATCCDDIVTMLSDQADRIEELEAAQHQGAPVAWMYRREGGECLGQLVQMESDSLKEVREGKVCEGRRILWPREDYTDWKPLYTK